MGRKQAKMREPDAVSGLRRYTLASLVLTLIFGYLYDFADTPPIGLIQRIAIGVPVLFVVVVGWEL